MRQLRSVAMRSFVVAMVLAGALVAVVSQSGANAFAWPASLTIRVHSCPDDLNATGFYQYGQRCTSTTGLFGVPLKIVFADGKTTYMYSQPSDDESRAQPIKLLGAPAGLTTVSEIVSTRVRESVVFCSLQPGGAFPTPQTNIPPTMDGDEVPITDGTASFNLQEGDALDCDWYRFPGGIAADDTDEEPNPDSQGGMIQIHKLVCNAGDLPTQPDPQDLDTYLADLQATCTNPQEGFSFDLADDTDDGQDYPEQTIGSQDGGYQGWSGLVPAQYAISESLNGDLDEPIVLCEGHVPNEQDQQQDQQNYDQASNLVLLEAHHGGVSYDLKQDETLQCEWFNVSKTGNQGGQGNGGQDNTGDTGDDGNGQVDDGINDHDDDGIIDADEAQYGTDPNNADTDGDGVGDGDEVIFGYNPLVADTDSDGLSDSDEAYSYLTDPTNPDSDGDGVSDGAEAQAGTDPLDPASL